MMQNREIPKQVFRKLYIIGNGFDIHHGLKTGYCDFHKWLQHQKDYSSVEEMECFFAVEDLWRNFEENLGRSGRLDGAVRPDPLMDLGL